MITKLYLILYNKFIFLYYIKKLIFYYLQYSIYYELPDAETRFKLFEQYLKPLKRDSNINLNTIVEKSEGLSPADIKMIAEEAMKLSIIDARNNITEVDLNTAVEKFLMREKLKNKIKEV